MMGLLYFPDEHKFAVYTPLFAPLGISMLAALLREAIAWKKRKAAAREVALEKKKEGAEPVAAEGESTGVSTAVDIK
jgi:phosphatidylinositol glycan class S